MFQGFIGGGGLAGGGDDGVVVEGGEQVAGFEEVKPLERGGGAAGMAKNTRTFAT